MTPAEQLAARWLADVPTYSEIHDAVDDPVMFRSDVLAAIARLSAGGDDLVDRLQGGCNCNFPETTCGAEDQCRLAFEAAARISSLTAERDEWRKAYHDTHDLFAQSDEDAAQLRARLARMEGALRHEVKRGRRHLAASTLAILAEADAALTDGGSNG